MKIQLDTESKIIKIENSIKFGELVEALEKLLPKGEWKKYELQTNTIINSWTNPIIIKEYPQPIYPSYPWITFCHNADNTLTTSANELTDLTAGGNDKSFATNKSDGYETKAGIYNVEL